MFITEKEVTRIISFAVFSCLRRPDIESLEEAMECACTEVCDFCEAEGIDEVDVED